MAGESAAYDDWESAAVKYFSSRCGHNSTVVRGIGDDAALLAVPAGEVLAVSMDTLVEGRHFPKHWHDIAAIGHLALAVNLSDMAATAATPRAAFLALTLPEADNAWIDDFANGFCTLADQHKVVVAGGDITRGPRAASVTICGCVPDNEALGRGGAKPGDLVFVSGSLGGAALGYSHFEGTAPASLAGDRLTACMNRLLRPQPRVSEGLLLRKVASACTDLSDGIVRNLALLLAASNCGAEIILQQLPLDSVVAELVPPPQCWQMAISFGGDYELCCTVPPQKADLLEGSTFTCIGKIVADQGLHFINPDGSQYHAVAGYSHFD